MEMKSTTAQVGSKVFFPDGTTATTATFQNIGSGAIVS